MNTYYYCVDECSDGDYRFKSEWNIDTHPEYVAEDAAEDYHKNHDGYEDIWPLVFCLHKTSGGQTVGKFSVEREAKPIFNATRWPHFKYNLYQPSPGIEKKNEI